MHNQFIQRVWGEASALFDRSRRVGPASRRLTDLLIIIGLFGVLFGLIDLMGEWTGELQPEFKIELSPLALPRYTFYSLSRGLLAYVLSLGFTLVYGYWAAKDHVAERILIPLLDILQSIPVLGFMPGVFLALIAAFPSNNIGLELAAIIMIFTGQAWNMTFSWYHSLRSVPNDQQEVATVYRFSWWQRFRWVELPFGTVGLVWNSMMSMAGGWFFLMLIEVYRDFRLPGIGSYMDAAVKQKDVPAMLWALFAMTVMIVLLDQLLWRPLVVWSQKFRVEEGGQQEVMTSWFLDWLRRSPIIRSLGKWLHSLSQGSGSRGQGRGVRGEERSSLVPSALPLIPHTWATIAVFVAVFVPLAYGAWKLVEMLGTVPLAEWWSIFVAGLWTLGRVLLATGLGTLWTLPAGLAIGLSPRWSRLLQPIMQIAASFPAPMLFPIVVAGLAFAGVPLSWGSIVLMVLGTQWYILFNVIAGAMAIPADLREAARSYRITGWQRFWVLYFPAVFPYLVTGWVTAAGGAWNASIVAEYVEGAPTQIPGLGARISVSFDQSNLAVLAACVVVMSAMVVLFNRLVWRRCYRLAEERFALNK
jgi:NitT/TauT family transport system permease protein